MFDDISLAYTWQNYLACFGLIISVVGVICILVVVVLTLAEPDGGDSLGITIATILAVLATLAVQLLFGGVLVERETLSSRLPKVTLGRLLIGVVAVSIVLPVMSFAFGLGMVFICVCGIFLSSKPNVHLRGLAVCNLLLCLGISEAMRRTCGWDDGGVARAVLAIYALGGTLLSGLFLLSSVFRMPLINKFLFCMFALASLHATCILLSGISTLLSRNLEDASVSFDTDYCIKSTVQSAASAFIQAMKEWQKERSTNTPEPTTAPRPTAPPAPVDPCAEYNLAKSPWREPSDAGIWAGIVFSLGGVWLVMAVTAEMIFHPGVKVSPEAQARRNSKQKVKPKLDKKATKEALERQRAKCVACCRAFVSSMERLICLLVLIGAAGGLVLIGHLKLKDSLASESRRLQSTNAHVTSAPEVSEADLRLLSNATDAGPTNATNSTQGTMPTNTTTTQANSSNMDLLDKSLQELVALNPNVSNVTTELSSPVTAGSTTIPLADVAGLSPGMNLTISDGNNIDTANIVNVSAAGNLSSGGRRLLPGSVTVDSPLEHSYATGATVIAYQGTAVDATTTLMATPSIADETMGTMIADTSTTIADTSTTIIITKAQCASLLEPGDPAKRPVYDGIVAWAHIPADRIGVVWCDYGEVAAMGIGVLMYCTHMLACSITLKRYFTYAKEDRQKAFQERMARARTKSKESGVSSSNPSGDEPGMESGFHLAFMQPRDPLPEYIAQNLDGRVYDV